MNNKTGHEIDLISTELLLEAFTLRKADLIYLCEKNLKSGHFSALKEYAVELEETVIRILECEQEILRLKEMIEEAKQYELSELQNDEK